MTGEQGGDISARKRILIFKYLTKLKNILKRQTNCHKVPTTVDILLPNP